jgi:hypothetical protein
MRGHKYLLGYDLIILRYGSDLFNGRCHRISAKVSATEFSKTQMNTSCSGNGMKVSADEIGNLHLIL